MTLLDHLLIELTSHLRRVLRLDVWGGADSVRVRCTRIGGLLSIDVGGYIGVVSMCVGIVLLICGLILGLIVCSLVGWCRGNVVGTCCGLHRALPSLMVLLRTIELLEVLASHFLDLIWRCIWIFGLERMSDCSNGRDMS